MSVYLHACLPAGRPTVIRQFLIRRRVCSTPCGISLKHYVVCAVLAGSRSNREHPHSGPKIKKKVLRIGGESGRILITNPTELLLLGDVHFLQHLL